MLFRCVAEWRNRKMCFNYLICTIDSQSFGSIRSIKIRDLSCEIITIIVRMRNSHLFTFITRQIALKRRRQLREWKWWNTITGTDVVAFSSRSRAKLKIVKVSTTSGLNQLGSIEVFSFSSFSSHSIKRVKWLIKFSTLNLRLQMMQNENKNVIITASQVWNFRGDVEQLIGNKCQRIKVALRSMVALWMTILNSFQFLSSYTKPEPRDYCFTSIWSETKGKVGWFLPVV